jgi:hypothetical protein
MMVVEYITEYGDVCVVDWLMAPLHDHRRYRTSYPRTAVAWAWVYYIIIIIIIIIIVTIS